MQQKWLIDHLFKTIGRTGKVLRVDSDGDVKVSFGGDSWTFNPLCLRLVNKDQSTRERSVPGQ